VKFRLQKAFPVALYEKRRIVKKLYKSSKRLPLFAGKRVLCWEPAPWPAHIAMVSAFGCKRAQNKGVLKEEDPGI